MWKNDLEYKTAIVSENVKSYRAELFWKQF